jgi:hypothetical protein
MIDFMVVDKIHIEGIENIEEHICFVNTNVLSIMSGMASPIWT